MIGPMFAIEPKQPTAQAVTAAIAAYAARYQRQPTHCYLNPATFTQARESLQQIEIKFISYRAVLPNVVWIGED